MQIQLKGIEHNLSIGMTPEETLQDIGFEQIIPGSVKFQEALEMRLKGFIPLVIDNVPLLLSKKHGDTNEFILNIDWLIDSLEQYKAHVLQYDHQK